MIQNTDNKKYELVEKLTLHHYGFFNSESEAMDFLKKRNLIASSSFIGGLIDLRTVGKGFGEDAYLSMGY